MDAVFGPIILGVFLLILGASNMRGKINSIHWYHRKRVREEDVPAFGRLMGLGTILCGVGVIAFGVLTWLSGQTGTPVFEIVGSGAVTAALAAGLGLSVYAMLKYNKGIF